MEELIAEIYTTAEDTSMSRMERLDTIKSLIEDKAWQWDKLPYQDYEEEMEE